MPPPADPSVGEIAVTVGATTDRSAVVWARAAGPGLVELEVTPVGGDGAQRFAAQPFADSDFAVKLHVGTGRERLEQARHCLSWHRATQA